MAKRGTLDHPKTKRLGRQLDMPAWAALGLLEAVWHWVGRYRPTGFLTGDDLADIADTIRYESGGALASDLVSTGWLDEVEGGWYIHDWHDHADDTVKKTLAKRGEKFANGSSVRKQSQPELIAPEAVSTREPIANDSRTVREQSGNDERVIRDKPEPKPEPKPVIPSGRGDRQEPPAPPPDAPVREGPFELVQQVLRLVAEAWELPEPTREDVTRWIAKSSPLMKLLAKHPPETVAKMYMHESQFGTVDWHHIYSRESSILRRMAPKAPPPPEKPRDKFPVQNRDYHVARNGDGELQKFWIRNGEKTDEPFSKEAWDEARGLAVAS